MIQPERKRIPRRIVAGLRSYDPVPAAGHLGVTEEKCSAPFEESHWMPGFATLGGLPCEHCGATV